MAGALKDRGQVALWMKRLEEDRSTLYIYRAMLAAFIGGDLLSPQ